MGMTMTQKILAAAAGLEKVEAGQLIDADLGTRGCPAAPRERPRESFFNASRGPSPLP